MPAPHFAFQIHLWLNLIGFRYVVQPRIEFYFIYTEIFVSNFAVWISVSDFTSTNQRGETSFSHVKKSFRPITNQGLSELCFRGLFPGPVALSGSFDHWSWQDNIFVVLELFVIQTYHELGDIFEDGYTIKKLCVSRQTYRQVYRRPKKTRTLF